MGWCRPPSGTSGVEPEDGFSRFRHDLFQREKQKKHDEYAQQSVRFFFAAINQVVIILPRFGLACDDSIRSEWHTPSSSVVLPLLGRLKEEEGDEEGDGAWRATFY